MKITLENLGPIKYAEFELGDLTIICGKNNTGKTYVTYATYGFLDYWSSGISVNIPNEIISEVMEKGAISVPIALFADQADELIKQTCESYSELIERVFAGNEKFFDTTTFSIDIKKDSNYITNEVSFKAGSASRSMLEVKKSEDEEKLNISLLVEKAHEDLPPRSFIETMISNAVLEIIFKNKVPKPFIASAERTGSAIFQKELDFTRNRLVELIGDKNNQFNSTKLIGRFSANYPIPVRKNVDFIRELPSLVNKESCLSKEHPEILERFNEIIGGEYKVTKDGEVLYVPNGKKSLKLTMVESSSAVRAMLDVGFYLRHVAEKGDLLIVDEPELNLHPANQRKIARLFASLVNVGIKVFITTHSDYIIKELNTLIMLNSPEPRIKEIAKNEEYNADELLTIDNLRVYIAKEDSILIPGKKRKIKCNTLIPTKITEQGIEINSFDDDIEIMSRIQDEVIWGE